VLQRQHSENLKAPAAIPPTSLEQSGETTLSNKFQY